MSCNEFQETQNFYDIWDFQICHWDIQICQKQGPICSQFSVNSKITFCSERLFVGTNWPRVKDQEVRDQVSTTFSHNLVGG